MSWKNIRLIFLREVRDQLRDRRTLFIITILPVLLYPMLGLGGLEMMMTFSEQPRTVVILNDRELPESPALLDDSGIAPQWFDLGKADAAGLRIVRESVVDEGTADSTDGQQASTSGRRGRKPEELLRSARGLVTIIDEMGGLRAIEKTARAKNDILYRVQATELQKEQLHEELNRRLAESGIHVLVIVPPGYRESLMTLQTGIRGSSGETPEIGERESSAEAEGRRILVVSNSADDRSAAGLVRIRRALALWESAIRQSLFDAAHLPPQLQNPANLSWLEVAREEQVAASIWSKMFPAMLVLMSLTGAFYPAIDLGAGEKERGTMETLLISPARRIEIVFGKFLTILLFSIGTAVLNVLSMCITGQQIAKAFASKLPVDISPELPQLSSMVCMLILLLLLGALFSALCLALATFARSTREGQYYLTPLLMVVMGMTLFSVSPAVDMTPLYSILPVINVALMLKGLLLNAPHSTSLVVYAVPVLVSSLGYAMLALWWAIDLYNREDVLFRESEKFDLKLWLTQLVRTKDAVPAFPEAVFCFVLILMLHFAAMTWMTPKISGPDAGRLILRTIVIQQLVVVACPAAFMGFLLTTSPRATFRLRRPKFTGLLMAVGLALAAFPLSYEFSRFLVDQRVFPELPQHVQEAMARIQSGNEPTWLLIVVYALTPAICEEIAFRGFILSGLARGGRLAIAIVISSMMFGIVHMIPQQAFNATLLGLVLGLLAVYSRSLFPAITFHFCYNALATLHTRMAGVEGLNLPLCYRDAEGTWRFSAMLLIPVGVLLLWAIVAMIRTVIREQDLKRRGIIPAYSEEPTQDGNGSDQGLVARAL